VHNIGTCVTTIIRWDFMTVMLADRGRNTLAVHFKSNTVAAAKGRRLVYCCALSDVQQPVAAGYNYLRKTQCHAGWDWNIALSRSGFYGDNPPRKLTSCVRRPDRVR
jgi:beta-mannosidase